MKAHNYTPKVNCPSCRRDVNANNDGVLDPHYDQRVGKICLGGGKTPAETRIILAIAGSGQ